MKLKFACTVLLLLLLGCAAYKELEPEPEIIAKETEYIEIVDKDKPFELEKDNKYFMKFPAPQARNFYLVLRIENKDQLDSYLTRQFNQGKPPIIKMEDQSKPNDNLGVYEADQIVPTYYWVIEQVEQEMMLDMEYRYVPIWRYRFETKRNEFQTILAKNKVDRETFETLGKTTNAADLNFDQRLDEINRKSENLKAIQDELAEIESIFPENIKGSDDRAYLDYIGLKDELENELEFQDNFALLLELLKREKESRNNDEQFVEAIPEFLQFFEQKENYPANVVQEMQEVIGNRLADIGPYYQRKLRQKSDAKHIDLPTNQARDLFKACNKQPGSQFEALADFIDTFNRKAAALSSVRDELSDIQSMISSEDQWPSSTFYKDLQRRANSLSPQLPAFSKSEFGEYSDLRCVSILESEIADLRNDVTSAQSNYRRAADVASQVNRYRNQSNYRAIIELLKNNRDLDFLISQYPDLDQLALTQYEVDISRAIENQNWAQAERGLRNLDRDRNFLNYSAIASKKASMVRSLENKLFSAIEEASRRRVNSFIENNKATITNVEELYNNDAFTPAHTLTFSSGGGNILAQKQQELQNFLDSYKYNRFPKAAIGTIYRDFSQNIRDNGVAKARAIITHGKYYKGDDRKINNLVAEVDPLKPKWITEPKEYRRIYVLPVNENQQSQNDYMFRLNLQIPSEAKFPVFDVNIKLPREVASSAGQQQWYEKMTMNDKILKNEGRFSITSPTKDNNWECQITPLQVNKDRDNILEVRFKQNAFKVLEISVMAQRPIIKKN